MATICTHSRPTRTKAWVSWGGLRYFLYFGSSQVALGLAAYYGSPTGGNLATEYMTYGGVLLSWEYRHKRFLAYEFDLLTGIGEGVFREENVYQKSFYTVQPSASIGVNLGGGWRLSGVLTYVHLSRAPQFSGPSLGFRFDYKTQTSIKQLNE